MRLTVLNVAYPAAPVDADPVGGAEQILAALDRAVVAAGHRSLVIACEGSQAAGTLVPTPRPSEDLSPAARQQLVQAHRQAITETLQTYRVDVVHLHGIDCPSYLPPQHVPTLVTLHLPPGWYPAQLFGPQRPGVYLNCVSQSQRRACPETDHLVGVVENGVDLSRLQPSPTRGEDVVVLGRICSEKGQHLALQAAHRADVPLVIAGRVFPYPEHIRYYESQVVPLLDERRRYVGPTQGRDKVQLLAAARCLLVPSSAPETSSLVAMESLACGTPVVALSAGALPEIVQHGETGFVVDNVDAMAAAIGSVGGLAPAACRIAAEARFDAAQMCDTYLRLYESLAAAPLAPAVEIPAVVGKSLKEEYQG